MAKHRVGIIGCGALAQGAHLPNVQKNPRTDLVCACDINPAVAEDCRRRFGARRAETDWHKVVDASDIDLVILCTRHALRGEIIIPALKAGKPVYTEKPLAPSRTEIRDIVLASRETGKPVCVGHNRRSSPAILEFRRLLQKAMATPEGKGATVDRAAGRQRLPEETALQILMRVNDDARSWKRWVFLDNDEGVLFAEMVHFVDLALWFNRSPAVRVFVEGSPRGNFAIVLRFADGSITTMHHTMVGNFDYPKELIEATVNHITIAMDHHIEIRQIGLLDEPALITLPFASGSEWAKEQGMMGYIRAVERETDLAAKEDRPARWLNVNKGHAAHLDRFLDHLDGRGENPCAAESAVAVNLIAMKMLESARLGMPVVLGPEDWNIPDFAEAAPRSPRFRRGSVRR